MHNLWRAVHRQCSASVAIHLNRLPSSLPAGLDSRLHPLNFSTLADSSSGIPVAGPALHFCIVGSGPAGFYTAEKLLKQLGSVASVSLLDKLPHPYGLVRTGVAPDHADTKNVINQFFKAAQHPHFRFFGNVTVGKDVSVAELQQCYHGVILAYGAESHNKLNVPGENLKGVHSAREFVEWYNGHPEADSLSVDLSGVQTVAICGLGNVAVDCARILLQSPERLQSTDIAEHALSQLRRSAVSHVHLIGRRGVVQAAFTPKELRELLTLPGAQIHIADDDLVLDEAEKLELKSTRMKRRIYDIIATAAQTAKPSEATRHLHLDLKQSLAEIHGNEADRVAKIDLQLNQLVRDPLSNRVTARGTGQIHSLECELVLGSIGYCSVPLPGVPFDSKRGIIPNSLGRVLQPSKDGEPAAAPGLYTVGWVKRGPTGIIGSNLVDAQQTVECIKEDIGKLPHLHSKHVGAVGLQLLLRDKGCRPVSFEEWTKIDLLEIAGGQKAGKPREKFTSSSAMLACL